MKIDHIGIVVKNLEKGAAHWERCFGYEPMTKPVLNTRQKVYVLFLKKEDSVMIKLIAPAGESSPVYRFAERGGGLHHLCFKCDNLKDGIEGLKSEGYRQLSTTEPGEAFGNEMIAFLLSNHGINIELIDTDKKADVI